MSRYIGGWLGLRSQPYNSDEVRREAGGAALPQTLRVTLPVHSVRPPTQAGWDSQTRALPCEVTTPDMDGRAGTSAVRLMGQFWDKS